MKINSLILLLIFLAVITSKAQVADFSFPSSLCLNQTVVVSNTSTGAQSYVWDFCQDGFLHPQASAINIATVPSSIPVGIEMVYDQGNWYGFVCSRDNSSANKLTRLSFGSSIDNPSPTILPDYDATINSSLNGVSEIKFVYLNNQWYGFVVNYYSNDIIRIAFGTSVANNSPAILNMGNAGGWNAPYGLDIIENNGDRILAVTGNSSNTISLVNYTSTIDLTTPVASAVTTVNSATNSLITSPIKIGLQNSDNGWYALVSTLPGPVLLVALGTDPMAIPNSISSIANIQAPSALQFKKDGINYFGFVQNNQGNLFRIGFGSSITNSPKVDALGNFGETGSVYGLSIVKAWPEWKAFFIGVFSNNVYKLDFKDVCQGEVSLLSSTDVVPSALSYPSPGNKIIELAAFGASLNMSTKQAQSTVNNVQAPVLGFTSDNNCLGQINHFNGFAADGSLLSNGLWDFGSGNSATGNTSTFQFPSLGDFPVMYSATASNGCSNVAVNKISIFNPPQANFTLPSVSPFCSNQSYQFTNTSTFDNGSSPTWQWSVNGNNVAITQDLNYLIPSTVAQDITLTASIPGCSSQSTQSISTVQDGPLANFSSPATGCVGTSILFTNTTTGTVTSYGWTFGDGNSSSQANATNTYASAGNFAVTLTAFNVAGCQNFTTKNFPVYSNPQPDFAIEAPPYSCANYPAQFDNNTPPLSDSNITTWAWSFGDAANGTSNQKNPTYTYTSAATYNVMLQAISNFGCSGTKQHSVIINPSPQSGFTNTPACVNQNTQFTDASSGSISSYQWVIQSTILTGANPPPYVFTSAGTFPVSLTTTSGNGCKNQVVKNVNVPVPPVMDFVFQSPYAGTPTIFQELNPGGSDPSVAWNWNFGPGSGTGSPVSYTYATAGVYSVTLSATRTSGCIYSTSKNISIYDGPVAKFTPSTQGGAAPLTVTFNNESKADSYFWQFGDTNNSTSSDFSPEFTYTQLGQYKVLLTASNIHSCIDTVSTKIYVVIPKVDLAMKSFSLVEDPSSNSSKPVVTILNLGNIPLTNPEVQIDLGGNAVLKEKIILTILPGKSIQQTLSLAIVPQTLGYICAEVAPTGDINIYNDRQCVTLTNDDVLFYPYPNPAKGQINFDWISSGNENIEVIIYKSTGQIAFLQNFQMIQSGINQLAIDVSSLSSGLYLVQFSGAKEKKTFNVMVIN